MRIRTISLIALAVAVILAAIAIIAAPAFSSSAASAAPPRPPSRRSSRSTSASAPAARRRWLTTPSATTTSTPTCSPSPRRSSSITPTGPTGRAPGNLRRQYRLQRLRSPASRRSSSSARAAPSISACRSVTAPATAIGMNWTVVRHRVRTGVRRSRRSLDGPADPQPPQAGRRRTQARSLPPGALRHQDVRRRRPRHRERFRFFKDFTGAKNAAGDWYSAELSKFRARL